MRCEFRVARIMDFGFNPQPGTLVNKSCIRNDSRHTAVGLQLVDMLNLYSANP